MRAGPMTGERSDGMTNGEALRLGLTCGLMAAVAGALIWLVWWVLQWP